MDSTRHAQDRNFLESLLRQIPGFKGYLEEEYRRESDYLTRIWLCDQLQLAKHGIDRYLRRLADNMQLDALPLLERLRGRVDGFMSCIRSADRGYSAMFDFVRTGEADLDQVYQVDLSLVDGVQGLASFCGELTGKTDSPQQLADDVQRRLEELETKFRQRGEILQGLGK